MMSEEQEAMEQEAVEEKAKEEGAKDNMEINFITLTKL